MAWTQLTFVDELSMRDTLLETYKARKNRTYLMECANCQEVTDHKFVSVDGGWVYYQCRCGVHKGICVMKK